MELISEHWASISLALLICVNVLNHVTEHYSERRPGLARLFLLLTEILSVVASKGAPKKWKLPGKTR